jgi:hypothetical protein
MQASGMMQLDLSNIEKIESRNISPNFVNNPCANPRYK